MKANSRVIGAAAETLAEEYLVRRGYTVLARNFCCSGGELDLVAMHEGTLVFVEVKYRRTSAAMRPAEAITDVKRLRLSRAVGAFLSYRGGWEGPMRFDVIEVTGSGAISHLENAFVPEGF